jgi:hypothetical protein
MNDNPKPKRRWFSYSLRTLLVFVTIASAGFGWLGYKMRQAQRQKEAVEAIRKLKGTVEYDYHCDVHYGVTKVPTPPGPAWLRKLLGDDFFANVYLVSFEQGVNEAQLVHLEGSHQLRVLGLGNSQVTDAGLAHLQRLTRLKNLQTFQCTQVTDAGLVHLQGLSDLEWLELGGAQVTDAGLSRLEGLGHLNTLYLGETKITDAGLIHLQGLSELEWLDLGGTQVTDAGLAHLQALTKLDYLKLRRTQVTDEGCKELQKALPNLRINRSY